MGVVRRRRIRRKHVTKQKTIRRHQKAGSPGTHAIHPRSRMRKLKDAGVSGFIEKGVSVNEFLDTIRSVANGGKVALLTGLTEAGHRSIRVPLGRGESLFGKVHLTGRERDVYSLIAAGLNKAQIAQRLGISCATLGRHVNRILRQISASGQ